MHDDKSAEDQRRREELARRVREANEASRRAAQQRGYGRR